MNDLKVSWKVSGTETCKWNTGRRFQVKLVIKNDQNEKSWTFFSSVLLACVRVTMDVGALCPCMVLLAFIGHLSEQTQGCALYQRRGQDFPPLRFSDYVVTPHVLPRTADSVPDPVGATWHLLHHLFSSARGCHASREAWNHLCLIYWKVASIWIFFSSVKILLDRMIPLSHWWFLRWQWLILMQNNKTSLCG